MPFVLLYVAVGFTVEVLFGIRLRRSDDADGPEPPGCGLDEAQHKLVVVLRGRSCRDTMSGETFEVDAGQLILRDGAGREVATFAAESNSVAGTSCEVTAYNSGRQAVVSVIIGTHITATFGKDGRITGNAGCNSYFASYDTDGESIAIGQPGATRRSCAEPEGVMTQEGRYLAALQSAATLRIDGNTMHLRTAGGSLAVTLIQTAGLQAMP